MIAFFEMVIFPKLQHGLNAGHSLKLAVLSLAQRANSAVIFWYSEQSLEKWASHWDRGGNDFFYGRWIYIAGMGGG